MKVLSVPVACQGGVAAVGSYFIGVNSSMDGSL